MNRLKHTSAITQAPRQGACADVCISLKAMLMQKLAWIIITSYALLLLQPVMPVLMDVAAHTFWEQQHMLTVHEEHGRFHVQQEVVKAGHHNHKHLAEMCRDEVVAYINSPVATKTTTVDLFVRKTVFSYYLCRHISAPEFMDYPPPKA